MVSLWKLGVMVKTSTLSSPGTPRSNIKKHRNKGKWNNNILLNISLWSSLNGFSILSYKTLFKHLAVLILPLLRQILHIITHTHTHKLFEIQSVLKSKKFQLFQNNHCLFLSSFISKLSFIFCCTFFSQKSVMKWTQN